MAIGITLVLLATISHSGSFIFRKRGLEEVDYKAFIVLRLAVGLVLTAVMLWSIGTGFSGLTVNNSIPFIVTGIIGNIFGLISTTMAIHEIGASRAHAFISASPLITAVLGAAFLGENLTVFLFLGIIIIVIAGGTLSYRIHSNQTAQEMKRPVFGFGLALYSTVAIGVFTVLQKYGLNQGVTPLEGLFIRFLTGSILYAIYLLIARPEIDLKDSYRSPNFIWASFLLTVSALLTLIGLNILPATLVAGLKRTAPLFTVLLSVFMLKGIEKIDWQTFVIAAAIVAGALLAIVG